jgi:hypothetical protein
MSSPVGDYLPYLKTGKLRLLAVSNCLQPVCKCRLTSRACNYRARMVACFLPGKASARR